MIRSGVAQQHLAVLERRRLALVGVANDVLFIAAGLENISPFLRGRRARAPHAAQVGLFQLGDQARADCEPVVVTGGSLELRGKLASGLIESLACAGIRRPLVRVDSPGPRRAIDGIEWHVAALEMRRDDCGSARGKVAHRSALQDPSLLGLPLAVQLDQHGRCAIAASQARDTFDLDPSLAAEFTGNRLKRARQPGAPRRWQAMSRQT